MNPIYIMCTPSSEGHKFHVVDLRTLPEDVKLNIIQAALGVAFHYGNGSYDVDEGTDGGIFLENLADATDAIEMHMHPVELSRAPA